MVFYYLLFSLPAPKASLVSCGTGTERQEGPLRPDTALLLARSLGAPNRHSRGPCSHTYLAEGLASTSGLGAAGRELRWGCLTQGQGLVAMVAGWILEGPFRFGIELKCTLGEQAGPCVESHLEK